MKVGELNGKIVLLSMQNKTLSGLLKELGGELTVGPSSEQYISAFRLLLAIKEGTLRGKLSDGERYKLFSLFDLLYADYVTRLLDKAPLLTKRDLEICCFLKFGLTNEELARIFQTSSDSVTKAKGRLKGRLGISSQEDLNAFLREEYGSSILGNKSTFWVNHLAPILRGTQNSQIIIPASDLLYMWKKKLNYLHKQNERLKSKHPDQTFEPMHIASYDLVILVNKYDSYLRWKEKQKILESEKEIEKSQNIVSQSIGYTNIEKDNSNDTDNISDLVDDIFG